MHHGDPAPSPDSDSPPTSALPPDVDPQIIEALKSKDRIYVLKLGESFESLITERRQRVELTPATSYQRLLVHRCSAYYKLSPENDPLTKGTIFVLTTQDSRIPDRRICELVPAESTAQPAFKIMRRSAQERRKPQSHSGSVAGDDLELSDVEASESGSLGGRTSTANSKKQRKTIEEREAAYNEARSRIFMDFEEKAKDKDMSASSSTLSLNGSTSTSAGGRSSIGDTEDTASSPTTESEWSAPSGSNSRDKKDTRRGGPPSATPSSSRSLRAGGSFHNNSSGGSSRNSRAPSPSFSYASLHDPTGQIFDPHAPNQGYYPPQYTYPPYSPPGQAPTPPYLAPHPYYPQHYNPYQPPPVPQHNPVDGSAPPSSEPYPAMHFQPPYGWVPHPHQQPLQSPPHGVHMSPPPQQHSQQNTHQMGPSGPPFPPHSPQYQPFPPPHGYGYPLNGYYLPQMPPPLPQGPQIPTPAAPHMNMQPPPPQQQQQMHPNPNYDLPRPLNGNQMGHPANGHFNNYSNGNLNHNSNGPRNGLGNGVLPNHHARTMPRNNGGPGPNGHLGNGIIGNGNANNGRNRLPPPNSGRSPWSYGPGIGGNGYTASMGSQVGDAMGPRFNSNRRTSGNCSSGGNSRSSSNCDEVSSTSSTTSSSSRRTYTSTTSSQHPLPPRPDWAVGIKAQPTLAATGGRAHLSDHSRTMSPISPPRSNSNEHNSPMSPNAPSPSQHNTPQTIVSLESTDFPPLTSSSAAAQEKKGPVVTGAWGNSRPVLSPTNGNISTLPGNMGVAQSPIAKQDENERVVTERPSPKVGDAFSPKIVRRPPTTVNGQIHPQQRPQVLQQERTSPTTKCDSVVVGPIAVTTLAGQVAAMSLGVGKELNGDVEQQQQMSYITAVSGTGESTSPSAVAVAPSQSM